jgi:dTDP-4-amino-4,6-dideoxygalactose transaminase/predicted dehydrogenase
MTSKLKKLRSRSTTTARSLAKDIFGKLPPSSKKAVKAVARNILRLLPAPKGRFTGKLAIHGGSPVRQAKFRPWPTFPDASFRQWLASAGPVLRQVFLSGTEGLPQPLAKRFAQEWARYCEAKYALLLPHGTDALRIGIAAALNHNGLEFGGEVIVPNLSFIASATAALDRRFGVTLVDVDAATLNLDPVRVEAAIKPGRTKAIMAVHLFGQPADMTSLRTLATKHSLALIEDSAQAHGAIHEMGRAGTLGDVAAFSFQTSKNLPSGEGGALTTNDSALFERAYGLHNVGRRLVGGMRWAHETLGWNCRPSEYVAALLLERLRSLESQQQLRWERFKLLRELLGDLSSVEPLGMGPGVLRHGVHMFVMRYRKQGCGGLEIDDFLKALLAEGVPLARGYEKTLSQQPVFANLARRHPEYVRIEETPVSNEAVGNLVYLPHPVFLSTPEEIAEVAAAFRKVEAHYSGISKEAFLRPTAVSTTATKPEIFNATTVQVSAAHTWCVGLIGAGIMGVNHIQAFTKTGSFQLAGIYDVRQDQAAKVAREYGCTAYATVEQLLSEAALDVAIIATPHWQHADIASLALQRGLHVICEKPLTATVEQADKVLAVASATDKLFAVVHQTRLEPSFMYAKTLLESGELGDIYRCSMIETSWRTEAYYRSSPWRGTWKGEGGGVLLNQAPHTLDRYAWLFGMPASVIGQCGTNFHSIEVEDMASAIFHHANGMHGSVHVNSCENPAVSETVICGDRAKLILNSGRVRITRLQQSIRDATRNDERLWGELPSETQQIDFPHGDVIEVLLLEFYQNFAKALGGTANLICSGMEGRHAVELANAIVLSSAEGREVNLPLDRLVYSRFIHGQISKRALGK